MRGVSIAVVGFDDAGCEELSRHLSDLVSSDARVEFCTSDPQRLISVLESGVHIDILYMGLGGDDDTLSEALALARTVRRGFPWTQVVFWSSEPEHIMNSCSVPHAFFLLQPFDRQYVRLSYSEAYRALREFGDRPFGLKIGSSMVKLRPSQVLYVESNRHKILVHVCGGHKLETYLRIAQLAEFLPRSFMQVHKSFLVNMNHVVSFDADGLKLTSGDLIPVSQSKRKEVREAFARSYVFVRGGQLPCKGGPSRLMAPSVPKTLCFEACI